MTRPNKPFINDTSQAERRETLRNDRRASTYLSHTHPEDELQGRYKAVHTHIVVGNNPIPQYPASSPWTRETSGDEPPLGYCVNDIEPCGEPHEISASLGGERSPAALGEDAAPSLSPEVRRTRLPHSPQCPHRLS
jgi:hypothetical protein